MSGIAGILRFDQAPVDESLLLAMAQAMAYRSQDGTDVWRAGPVGLVHCHFWTTPEEVGERQPIRSPDRNHVLVADARVDNREELIALLAAEGPVRKERPTDADIILASYARWGARCLERLVGDFAVAVWDEDAQRLLLARDAVGMRQLFYAHIGPAFYFANSLRAILSALPGTPPLNRPLIAAMAARNYGPWAGATAYQGIHRMRPAESVLVDVATQRTDHQLYHVFGRQPKPDCRSDADWVEGVRHHLDEAIQCRLRSTTPIGILGGGGVDSASLACAAHALAGKQPPVHLYALTFLNTPQADEGRYFDAVAAHCSRYQAHRVIADDCWAFKEVGDDGGFPLEEPDVYATRALNLALLRAARGDGCRVAWMGEGGNQVFGHITYFQASLLRSVPWRDWRREYPWFLRGSEGDWRRLLFYAYVRPWLPAKLPPAIGRLTPWRRVLPAWFQPDSDGAEREIDGSKEEFPAPVGLSPHGKAIYAMLRGFYDLLRYAALDVASAWCGVEMRHPFFDRRLIEFCLHLPPHLLSWRGVDRVALRESMRGTLPEQVRTRRDKAHIAELFHRGMKTQERARIERLMSRPRLAQLGLVDAGKLQTELHDYWTDRRHDFDAFIPPVLLEIWLQTLDVFEVDLSGVQLVPMTNGEE